MEMVHSGIITRLSIPEGPSSFALEQNGEQDGTSQPGPVESAPIISPNYQLE